jgi:hypothetical protein
MHATAAASCLVSCLVSVANSHSLWQSCNDEAGCGGGGCGALGYREGYGGERRWEEAEEQQRDGCYVCIIVIIIGIVIDISSITSSRYHSPSQH